MAGRVGNKLGDSYGQQFEKLYEFLSHLVHGQKFENQILESHLYQARDMARRILFWFLNLLKITHVTPESINSKEHLNRKEILAAIDLGAAKINSLSNILSSLLPKFPSISSWLEP